MKNHSIPTTNPNPTVVKATVSARIQQAQSQTRADRNAVRRHQAALREIERWDVARETRPHTPALARNVLRTDDVAATIRDEPTMDAAVDEIRATGPAAPPRDYAADDHFVDQDTILAARYLAWTFTMSIAFFAGMALGALL